MLANFELSSYSALLRSDSDNKLSCRKQTARLLRMSVLAKYNFYFFSCFDFQLERGKKPLFGYLFLMFMVSIRVPYIFSACQFYFR